MPEQGVVDDEAVQRYHDMLKCIHGYHVFLFWLTPTFVPTSPTRFVSTAAVYSDKLDLSKLLYVDLQ